MPETTPLIKAALNLRVGAGFDVYATMGYSASPIFLLHGNPDKIVPKHNKFLNSSESYAIPYFSQRLCRWGVPAYAAEGRHKPFNLHTFRP